MSGIIFYKTARLKEIVDFYTTMIKAEVWLDQGKCVILKHGNMLFGFCDSDEAENCGIITFFYPNAADVNRLYSDMESVAETAPRLNKQFRIYHFFAQDPEGRKIEFQTFLHRLEDYLSGSQLLEQRRSVRAFSEESVDENVLLRIMEVCRYSPTSRNSQSYYYVITKEREKKEALAAVRDKASEPLSAAPLLVAVCAASDKTKRVEHDACIAAYHLLLAAAQFGLGTCWITDMNRPEVKETLSIPADDYVVCLTPLGYPVNKDITADEERLAKSDYVSKLPERRTAQELFRFV